MKIAVHTLVKNEEKFVWYAVNSIIDHIDKIYLWDTGSSDNTPKILKEIKKLYPKKVDLRLLKPVNIETFADARQKMLDATHEDWFIMLDGDEIWWESSITKLISEIKTQKNKLESIVVPTINLVGDIYHRQEEAAGKYNLAGRHGHLNLRAINRSISGLSSQKPHGIWGWTDKEGTMIQDRDSKKIKFINAPYLHASFLQRAGTLNEESKVPKRARKLKYELGIPFPLDFYYPESFFKPHPEFVPSPWKPFNINYQIKAAVQTPVKMFKRRFLPDKVGY